MPKLMKGFVELQQGANRLTYPAMTWPEPERVALGISTMSRDRATLALFGDNVEGEAILYATAEEPLTLYLGLLRGSAVEKVDEATFGHAALGHHSQLLMDAVAQMAARRWESWQRAARDAELEAQRVMLPILASMRTEDN